MVKSKKALQKQTNELFATGIVILNKPLLKTTVIKIEIMGGYNIYALKITYTCWNINTY